MKFQFGLLILGGLKRRKFHLPGPCGSTTSTTGLGSVATAGTYTTTEGLSECVRRATKFHKKLQTQLMITNQLQRNMDLNLQITYGTFLKSIQNLEKHFNNFFAFRKTF